MRRLTPWLPALAWAALVWFVGGIGDLSGLPQVPHLDKAAHFGLYGVLGLLLAIGWIRSGAGTRSVAAVAIALGLALGVADELRQGRLAGRSQESMDLVADAAGIATGFAIALRQRRRRTLEPRS